MRISRGEKTVVLNLERKHYSGHRCGVWRLSSGLILLRPGEGHVEREDSRDGAWLEHD